jgi:thioredoxin:protein disulfide reductase
MKLRHTAILSVLFAMMTATWAQSPWSTPEAAPADPAVLFTWDVSTMRNGDTTWVLARLAIAPDHYVYASATKVSSTGPEHAEIGETRRPHEKVSFDKFEGRDVGKFVKSALFRVPIVSSRTGSDSIRITLSTRGCSDGTCYFPMSEAQSIPVELVARTETPSAFSGEADLGGVIASQGVLVMLLVMFVGGLLTSLTPCVYPLIPITVAFFGASGASAGRGFILSVFFVLGMAVMYSILGVTAAATGAVFGAVMTNPWVMGAVALVFLAFAASMFGAFKIQLPSSLQLRLNSVGGSGFGGAFLAGVVAGIIAAPCTGPVLGTALAYVATTGDLWLGFLSMFTFAIGMGVLFMLIGTFSASIVPRSGAWLGVVESVFGVVMIVAALYFLREIIPALKSLATWGTTSLFVSLGLLVAGILAGAFHLRFVTAPDGRPAPTGLEKMRKAVGIVLAVAGLYGGVSTAMAEPAESAAVDVSTLPHPKWITDEAEGLRLARESSKPVLIDAYADWCVACRELDAKTYSDVAVLKRLDDFVAIKLDFTDSGSPANRVLTRKYAIVGLPTIIVLDSTGEELRDRRITGFIPPADLLEKLKGVQLR